MSSILEKIQDALPSGGVPANGLFDPSVNLVPDTFNTTNTAVAVSPFNNTLIGDASYNLVGSPSRPYLPIALPAYIPTLYKNVYHIQTNLKNVIDPLNTVDNREYPTNYAVKKYVETASVEFLDPSSVGAALQISTVISTSFISANDVVGPNVDLVTDNGVNTYTTSYKFDDIEDFRHGAEKTIICQSKLGEIDAANTYALKIVLQGPNVFLVQGTLYKTYEFIVQSETLNLYQYQQTGTRKLPGLPFIATFTGNIFIVPSFLGQFSDEVTAPINA
jgi:hypothetical protein